MRSKPRSFDAAGGLRQALRVGAENLRGDGPLLFCKVEIALRAEVLAQQAFA